MGYRNIEMERMLQSLDQVMERRDMIGYAAARNARVLRDELREYAAFKDELITRYGEEERDDEGNPTGRVALSPLSPRFADFLKEMDPIAGIEHEPELFKLKFEEAIGQLSGTELLELDWMFEEGE